MSRELVLVWPWLAAALGTVVLGVALLAWVLRRRRSSGQVRWVAHTDHLDAVPEVRRALRAHRVREVAGAVVLVVAVVAGTAMAARPVTAEEHVERLGTRDIVLCLDVSGSMVPFDSEIVDTFRRLVDGFSGERIALSIFDSTTRTVFPLTDDYTLVAEELEAASRALDFDIEGFDPDNPLTYDGLEELVEFTAGTYGVEDQASLVGDGLAGCALLFDERETERSRSIVLATDNDVYGEPIYTLPQAVELVSSRDVALYGLYGGAEELRSSPQNAEFTEAVEAAAQSPAGGGYWYAEDAAAVETILRDVSEAQVGALGATPEVIRTDRPQPWFTMLLVAVPGLVLLRWRSRS